MKVKFNLGWILAVAAAIALAGMGFMSFYYLKGGELLWGIIVAACLLIIPIVVSAQLLKAKECAKPFYFHKAAVTEVIMLAVMLVVLVVSMGSINHFYTVNSRTNEINKIVSEQSGQLDDMIDNYKSFVKERTDNYKLLLRGLSMNEYGNELIFAEVFPNGDTSSIQLKVDNFKRRIDIIGQNSGITTLNELTNKKWWELSSIMLNVDNVSNAVEKEYKELVQRSHNDTVTIPLMRRMQDELKLEGIADIDYWDYNYTKADDVMYYFTNYAGFVTSIWTIISAIVCILLIMLPYFVAERDSRSKGLIKEFGKNEEDDGNLFDNGSIGKV